MLTTLTELKGYEEARGAARPKGVEHGALKDRTSWLETPRAGGGGARHLRPALRPGHRRRPGRDRPRRPAAPARGAVARHRQALAPRRPVARAVQVAVPARPGLVRPPALHQVPRQLAGLRAQGQDRRLARVLHQGDGDPVLDEHRGEERDVLGGDGRVDRPGGARRQAADAAPPAAGPRDRHVREAERPRPSRSGRVHRATSTTPRRTPARTRTPARRQSSSAATTPRSTSAARCGSTTPT